MVAHLDRALLCRRVLPALLFQEWLPPLAPSGRNTFTSRIGSSRHGSHSRSFCRVSFAHEHEQPPPLVPLANQFDPANLLPAVRERYFERFKLMWNTKLLPDVQPVDDRFRGVPDSLRPVVLLFGWAGANEKNLAKYSSIYKQAGCDTVGFNLPTDFIFYLTTDVPYLARELLDQLQRRGLAQRPIFIHAFSDTGSMCVQGLSMAMHGQQPLDVKGYIFDSCPNVLPGRTFTSMMVLSLISAVCARRDGNSTTREIFKFWRKHGPTHLRTRLNLPQPIRSQMNGMWCGDFIRKLHQDQALPAILFLFSKKDIYVKHTYLEQKVIPPFVEAGKDVAWKCWDGSQHVGHFKRYPDEYRDIIHDFLHRCYFSKAAA